MTQKEQSTSQYVFPGRYGKKLVDIKTGFRAALERAGIKVEQLEVNVAGSDVGSELFERSIAQNRPKITTRILNAEEAGVLSSPTEVISRSSGEYVGSSGVNLFA